jgi:hypothetical protein
MPWLQSLAREADGSYARARPASPSQASFRPCNSPILSPVNGWGRKALALPLRKSPSELLSSCFEARRAATRPLTTLNKNLQLFFEI